ncbi:valine--tRNA ligase [Candidatus Hydrogenosomobacter endosymbioticus]|uniref:Valine--tRNA ligase n=2 Tax=Candidatus Hydrogenosomobacter endosymbioticus TaxID=2558174 RepID=A0ABM7V8R3_9PROT|nr:valine--tRNA ligase [Candidatus Hydrogenosomobacter endosymbioticus]
MTAEMPYPFRDFEEKWRKIFENGGREPFKNRRKKFCITMPPPNVTGRLHLGHIMSSTEQDIVIRFKSMCGYDAMWIPGLDHAGIATQMMVEKELQKNGTSRKHLGREKFLEKVWEWKEKYGGFIIEQMKRMGFLADWSSLKFTMDSDINKAVTKSFIELYKRGYLYRDLRLVNWDPALQTALSDLEIVSKEEPGTFWYIRYFINNTHQHIDVATTRPETIFADTAIAVHPDDIRYSDFVGKMAEVPLIGRKIPIVSDQAISMNKGTGAVKITPAHDYTDFDIAKRHSLPFIDIFDDEAKINRSAPEWLFGLDQQTARAKTLEALKDSGHLVQEENISIPIPRSERSGAVIEPRLTHQWFIDTKAMANKAMASVKNKEVTILQPEQERKFFEWMENIRPWCVSRQLWWGHRIPAWFAEDKENGKEFGSANIGKEDSRYAEKNFFIAETEEEAKNQAKEFFGKDVVLRQDEDVLDTWFSSGLWPFSVLGWPENSLEMKDYYPNDVLFTGHDILFFWVSRMMMFGCELTGKAPFSKVYLHPLIRDEYGKKMSKTKGNVIDPIELADEYGADALRLSMMMIATPSLYVRFGQRNVEQAKSFITKIWNVGKFCSAYKISLNEFALATQRSTEHPKWPINSWILIETKKAADLMREMLENYKFHDASHYICQFTRNIFCDWYIEFAKHAISCEDEQTAIETKRTLAACFSDILKMLHPIIPFVTEELHSSLCNVDKKHQEPSPLFKQEWPSSYKDTDNESDSINVYRLMEIVKSIRNLRHTFSIQFSTPLCVCIANLKEESCVKFFKNHYEMIKKLVKLSSFTCSEKRESSGKDFVGARIPTKFCIIYVNLDGIVDFNEERNRLNNSIQKTRTEIASIEKKLEDREFLDNAPEDVVENMRSRLIDKTDVAQKLQEALSAISL